MVIPLLPRISIRYLLRHPWQAWLTLLGISLGVAIVVAVDLANYSAKRSFALSLEMVAGKATHHIIGSTHGIPENFYAQLRTAKGLRASAPLISGQIFIQGRSYTLLGVDPFAEMRFRPSPIKLSESTGRDLFLQSNHVAMAEQTALQHDLSEGDWVEAIHQQQTHRLQISHIIESDHPMAAQGMLVADIATAQEILARIGTLDRIDLILENSQQQEEIRDWLLPGLQLVPSGARNQALMQLSRAFHINLSAMSLLALLVGGFLIYNTMTFMVLQRRELLGTLRALGTTRSQLFLLIIGEAAILGLLGTLAGIGLGIALGQGLVHLVTRTINDLYYVLEVSRFMLSPASLFKGLLLGIAVSVLAALLPALEASRSQPINVLQHASLQQRIRHYLPWLSATGFMLMVLGLFMAYRASTGLITGFVALASTIIGFSLLVPLAVSLMGNLVSGALKPVSGTIGHLAMRGISANLSRTGLATAALTIAIATTIGVGTMIGSFRTTVADWLEQSLNSDIYISLPGRMSNRTDAGIPRTMIDALENHPSIVDLWRNRTTKVESEWGPIRLMAISHSAVNNRGFNLKEGDPEVVRSTFFDRQGVLISEPLAYHRNLKTGDRLKLHASQGEVGLPVLGVFYDYTSSHGLIIMPHQLYRQLWNDDSISAVGLYGAENIKPQQLLDQVRQISGHYAHHRNSAIQIRANSEIKATSLAIFDRTFTITHVLRLLSVVVAFIGILSALMALQLEKTSEFALLRATGATPSEVSRIILIQTGVIGLFAGILAIPLGFLMSNLLIDVINLRSFGWSMQHIVSGQSLLEGMSLAIIAALLAGLYPALHASRLPIAQALRDE